MLYREIIILKYLLLIFTIILEHFLLIEYYIIKFHIGEILNKKDFI